jgi:hypothetical protein
MPALPGKEFDQPWEKQVCSSLVDVSRLWDVPGDPVAVLAYLHAHPPNWIPYSGSGSQTGRPVLYFLTGYPAGPGWSSQASAYELDLTVASTGSGLTGIRADGQVVPPGASCRRSGGP